MNGLTSTSSVSPAESVPRPHRPVEVRATRFPNVAVVIVTWNRHEAVSGVLAALARQRYPVTKLDVVVVDNASTDGTTQHLAEQFRPELIVDNPAVEAHEPAFRIPQGGSTPGAGSNALGFRSLAVIRNTRNHGGCGGFNTGLAFVADHLDRAGAAEPPAYVWLVDDDVDLPDDAGTHLVGAAEVDPSIGIVGSRTVDFARRDTTIETTIYFDSENGWMSPDPPPGHRLAEDHRRWIERVGGTRGVRDFCGIREVDVVSACSLLARWSAVRKVGFWDKRYFIYCDDADWCLRFGKAGYRVVCNLDAVVFHTYWLSKLTPARAYYSQRNLVWLMQKVLGTRALRRATFRRLASLLVDARKAATHCRLFHAEIIRRTAHDIVTGRGGKLDNEGPKPTALLESFERAGALGSHAEVLVMCSHPGSIEWADQLRAALAHALLDRGRLAEQPRWTYLVRQGVRDPGGPGAHLPVRIVFEPNKRSKWRSQRKYLRRPPHAVVVFDQSNDFPLIRGTMNIHVDRRRPEIAQVERDGFGPRLAFLARFAVTALRCMVYAWRVRPIVHAGRYG